MIRAVSALLLAGTMPVLAQETDGFPETDFVSVQIDGSLNLRAGPTTDSERLARLDSGTLLRRVDCLPGPEEDWCEVETLDGSIEGWAAVRFLRPHLGADPAALESPTVAASERFEFEAPARFATSLKAGEIFDLLLTVPPERQITISIQADDTVGTAVFDEVGDLLGSGQGTTEFEVVLLSGKQVLVRFAEMAGEGGDWSLDVIVD
ncbi:SH3 domain-containing protein [Lutimaribacter marinistellae]|uniref:SH3 domain-containing protein n=1 Tax=Lutimaribacter marinistellae TaxID=1820329 RepID=A0ABV7TCM1_9RHOB